MPPVRIGIIGLGGYAGSHHNAVARLEEQGHAKLVCTCDPQPAAFAAQQDKWNFAARRVRVFGDYRAMLDACHRELDVLVVPTPIQLHAEMHRVGVELGLAVYLEKPPTLDFLELEEMIARDRPAQRATLVGFNFIIEQTRLALKRRLLAGDFGAVRETRLEAQWPRPATYFSRNGWAGRLLTPEGRVVLDSCFGNAIAHFVHNMLFWAGGPELLSWVAPTTVRAELYRAHTIEGADTFFVEAGTAGGATLRFALTHACSGPTHQSETVVCEKATLHYVVGKAAEVRWTDGRVEKFTPAAFDPLVENHLEYYRYLRGESPRPATTLADCRPFVALNDLAYTASGRIAPIPPALVARVRNEQEQKDYFSVSGMSATQEAFLTHGLWPGAHGWERADPPAVVTMADLPRFHATVRAMAAV
jgi:predicted dehydrogenase